MDPELFIVCLYLPKEEFSTQLISFFCPLEISEPHNPKVGVKIRS
jgi:hypothetical protein